MARYDLEAIRSAAADRWPEVIAALTPADASILDGGHHPCPKCGGNDRFNFSRDGKGGAHCNQCQAGTGDGFGTIRWLNDWEFKQALAAVAKHLGIKPTKGDPDPAQHLQFLKWNRLTVAMWCAEKPPIKSEAVEAIGGRIARYRGEYLVIAIPVWGEQMEKSKPIGWVLYRADGGKLPKWSGKGEPEWVKVKLTAGSKAGLITNGLVPLQGDLWKTEGPTDLLAIISVGPDVQAFTTANGAKEKPAEWILKLCNGRRVNVVHDADKPGQDGATWVDLRDGQQRPGWCPSLARVATEARNVKLPYEVEPDHGSDLRDYLNNGFTFSDLEGLAESAQVFGFEQSAEQQIDEAEDDPQRLARVNLERYRSEHEGQLVFWRDEWWKWKEGRYRKIDPSELKHKVWSAVRHEFEQCWRERPAKDKPVKKVTRALVSNVIGAMESMCGIPASLRMPAWMPDRTQRHYLAAKNGILDLDAVFEGKSAEEVLLPHSPSWFSSFRLDYAFDEDADCPKWIDYLNYCMDGDDDRINLLQEWAGYLLTASNDLQKFLVLEGEGGNGKTVYFAAMTAMLGEDNVSHVSIENFDGRFELGTTIGKAANISGDAGEIDSVAEGVLKQFTGGDVMQFDRKNLAPISARPTAKLMAAWNSRPRIRDRSQGLWRRMLLVPFDRVIPSERRVLGMDRPAWWIDQGEAPGILLWAIVGLHRLRRQGRFTRSAVVDSAMDEYREDSNPATEFFSDYLEVADGSVEISRLYDLYTYWCKKSGVRNPLGSRQFGKEVRRKFPEATRKRVREGKKLIWKLEGINFSTEEIFSQSVDSEKLF